MLRVLFLILVVMVSFSFAQTKENNAQIETPTASEMAVFSYVNSGNIRYFMDMFLSKVYENSSLTGSIINYGKPKEILKREKILRNHIRFRNFDASRIKFVRGGKKKEFTTELWIVPLGAEQPKP